MVLGNFDSWGGLAGGVTCSDVCRFDQSGVFMPCSLRLAGGMCSGVCRSDQSGILIPCSL